MVSQQAQFQYHLDLYSNLEKKVILYIKYSFSVSHSTFFLLYHNVLLVKMELGNKCKIDEKIFLD